MIWGALMQKKGSDSDGLTNSRLAINENSTLRYLTANGSSWMDLVFEYYFIGNEWRENVLLVFVVFEYAK